MVPVVAVVAVQQTRQCYDDVRCKFFLMFKAFKDTGVLSQDELKPDNQHHMFLLCLNFKHAIIELSDGSGSRP